jgi:hypothetical protein
MAILLTHRSRLGKDRLQGFLVVAEKGASVIAGGPSNPNVVQVRENKQRARPGQSHPLKNPYQSSAPPAGKD